MERKLQERMIGAGILVLGLVVFGPMILDGGTPPSGSGAAPAGAGGEELRTQTFPLDPPSSPPSGASPPAGGPLQEPQRAVEQAAPGGAPQTATAPQPAEKPASENPAVATTAPPPALQSPAVVKAGPEKPASQRDVTAAGKPLASGRWLVQVGAFGQKVNAERLAARLRGAGFQVAISPVAGGDKILYGVRVGPAASPEEAAALARRLAAAGHPGRVVSQ